MAPVTRAWPPVMGRYQRGARKRPPIWFVAAVGICLANACDQPDKAVETPLPMPAEALPAPAPDNPARGPRVEPLADGSLPTFTTQNLATFEEQDARGALFLPSRETKLILDTLALQPGQAVADVGCGPGSMLYPFADVVGTSGKVYAVDVTEGEDKVRAMMAQKDRQIRELKDKTRALGASENQGEEHSDTFYGDWSKGDWNKRGGKKGKGKKNQLL